MWVNTDLEEVSDETIVSDLEDRRLRIFIDSDDYLTVLHACKMLDGARYSDGDV